VKTIHAYNQHFLTYSTWQHFSSQIDDWIRRFYWICSDKFPDITEFNIHSFSLGCAEKNMTDFHLSVSVLWYFLNSHPYESVLHVDGKVNFFYLLYTTHCRSFSLRREKRIWILKSKIWCASRARVNFPDIAIHLKLKLTDFLSYLFFLRRTAKLPNCASIVSSKFV
jgi:hypothetical protein